MNDTTTERPRACAEAQSPLALERLAAVARHTQTAVVVTDAKARIEWVNDAFTRLTGYALSEVVGRSPPELLHGPDTSPEAREFMRRAVAAGEDFEIDVLNYDRSGRQYWVHIESRPTHDEFGRLVGFIALQTDITAARISAARESLTQRVAALLLDCDDARTAARRVVAELVRELDVRAAQAWIVDEGSPTLRYLAGATADESAAAWIDASRDLPFHPGREWVVGVGAPGAAWGTRRTFVSADFWRSDRNGQSSRRSIAAQRSGIRTVCAVPVLGSAGVLAVIEIGGSHNYPGYEQLPSLLERVAEQLGAFLTKDASRRAFEAVFTHSPDAMLLVDAGCAVRSLNARALAVFGPVADQRLDALIDGGEDLARGVRDERIAPGQLVERRARRSDGSSFDAEVSLAAMPAAETRAVIVSVRDLTERKRMVDALTRSLREKESLVHEVHHRVKNSLQVIASMIALRTAATASPEARAALTQTSNRVQTIALVHRLLYVADDLSRVDMAEYLRALCGLLRATASPVASFDFDLTRVVVTAENAVPCGLIANELISQALAQLGTDPSRRTLRIALHRHDSGFSLSVSFACPDPSTGVWTSLEPHLIPSLARQLRASFHTSTSTETGLTTARLDVPQVTVVESVAPPR